MASGDGIDSIELDSNINKNADFKLGTIKSGIGIDDDGKELQQHYHDIYIN